MKMRSFAKWQFIFFGIVIFFRTASMAEQAAVFGSSALLHRLWSDEELRGQADDKKIAHLSAPDTVAPDKKAPERKLPALPPGLRNSIRSVTPEGGRKAVALTFDLCEKAGEVSGYDARIVNYLRANQVKATFFAGGKWMRSHPEKTMELMADPLFEVGNHSWSHANLRIVSSDEMKNQILYTQAEYEILWSELERRALAGGLAAEMEQVPRLPVLFRFPYGTCNTEALRFLADNGLAAIQWDVVTGDPDKNQTGRGITSTILNSVEPGSIIICHANGRGHGTAEALPLFIPELRRRGYEFLTVSELLRTGPAFASPDCYENRPGDNLHYDKIK